MHRHGYQGRKLHRDSAQRKALMRGFAISLIEHGRIETTLPRAKEFVPFIEPLITKAKRGDLASRRAVLSALNNQVATNTLVDQLVPQMGGRVSGHVRVVRTRLRVGDNAQLATVSFVDELDRATSHDLSVLSARQAESRVTKKATENKSTSVKKVSRAKTSAKPRTPAVKTAAPRKVSAGNQTMSHKPAVTVRKSGER